MAAAVVIALSIVYNAPQFAEREAYEDAVCGRRVWRTRKTAVFGESYGYHVVYNTHTHTRPFYCSSGICPGPPG